jgi:acetate kinase
VNAGSTSVKLAAFDDRDRSLWSAEVTLTDLGRDVERGLGQRLRDAARVAGRPGVVGHRIVHGGDRFDAPAVVDDDVERAIEDLAELAPLHNKLGLMGIRAALDAFGRGVPQVAAFDTAFHRTMPAAASTYGGPYEWIGQGFKRYGFHGISHEYAGQQAAVLLGRSPAELHLVTCHLGGGCSVTAISAGRSVDTTMGFTPLEGLAMVTRAGSIDPALVLHLLRRGATVDELEDVLENGSGLLGLSGVSKDLRDVIAARDQGDERATLAVDVFVHRAAAGVGAMIAALGTLDALVFTGGIGEHSAEIRERIARPFSFFGAPVLVVAAREELAIARAARRMVDPA